jgi:hypothetical protein
MCRGKKIAVLASTLAKWYMYIYPCQFLAFILAIGYWLLVIGYWLSAWVCGFAAIRASNLSPLTFRLLHAALPLSVPLHSTLYTLHSTL